jgi:hypothetical protein
MTPEPNQLLPDPGAPKPRPPWAPVVTTIVCALVLGLGSCFGFLSTLNFNGGSSPLNTAFMLLFLLCAAAFLGGVVWAFIRLLNNSSRR